MAELMLKIFAKIEREIDREIERMGKPEYGMGGTNGI